MNKEISPLEALGIIAYGKEMESCDVYVYRPTQKKAFQIVEDALKVLEQLQIILGAEKIKDLPNLATEIDNKLYSACYELKQSEKKLKALEIIKKQTEIGVVILGDKPHLRVSTKNGLSFYHLAQEEYDLLKEILK